MRLAEISAAFVRRGRGVEGTRVEGGRTLRGAMPGLRLLAALSGAVTLLGLAAPVLEAQAAHYVGQPAVVQASGTGNTFGSPIGLFVDSAEQYAYVSDQSNQRVVKVAISGGAETIVNQFNASTNNNCSDPTGVVADSSGNVYFTCGNNTGIYKATLSGSTYTVTNWYTGVAAGRAPRGMAIDSSNNIYIAVEYNTTGQQAYILKCSTAGAGSCSTFYSFPANGSSASTTYEPFSIAVDSSGNLYMGDISQLVVYKLSGSTLTNIQSCPVVAGPNNPGGCYGVSVDANGVVYAGSNGPLLYKLTPNGSGYTSNTVYTAPGMLHRAVGIAVNSSGTTLYAADYTDGGGQNLGNGVTAPSTASTNLIKFAASGEGFGSVPVGTTGSTTLTATFSIDTTGTLGSIAVLTQGIAGLDFANANTGTCIANHNYTTAPTTCTVNVTFTPTKAGLRQGAVELLNSSGTPIATAIVFGTGTGPQVNFTTVPQKTLDTLTSTTQSLVAEGLVGDAAGNLYIVGQNALYKETCSGSPCTYSHSTLATSVTVNSTVENFAALQGVAIDGAGNLYLGALNTAGTNGNGLIIKETLLSNGTYTPTVICSNNSSASPPVYCGTNQLAVDLAGNVYYLSAATVSGGYPQVEKLTVTVQNGIVSYSSPTALTSLSTNINPWGVAVDPSGDVFFTGAASNTLYELTPYGSGYVQSTLDTTLNDPTSIALDTLGNIYVANFQTNGTGTLVKETFNGNLSYTQSTLVSNTTSNTGIVGVWADINGNLFFPIINTTGPTYSAAILEIPYATPPSLTFATTNEGATTTTTTSGTNPVTLQNVGNAPFTLEVPSTGTNPSVAANFSASGSTNCNLLSTNSSTESLSAGSTCNLTVTFAPTVGGSLSGSLVLLDNNLNAGSPNYTTQTIPLSGTGVWLTPTVTGISPSVGPIAGGTTVTITGTYLLGATGVSFGGTAGTIVTDTSSSSLTATSPVVSSVGAVDVTVTTPGGTSATSSADKFLYQAMPTVTLAMSYNGNTVGTGGSVASGNALKLTATVKVGTNAVYPGIVAFCNAAASRCTDVDLLGTVPLTSAGTASISFVPGIGSYSYKAVFLPTGDVFTASSSTSTLTVTAASTQPTTTTISPATGSAGSYTLSATVTSTGIYPAAGPTGTVNFLDTTNSNTNVGPGGVGATLGTATATYGFASATSIATGTTPQRHVLFDYNNDGKLDLAVANTGGNTVTVYTGNGNGTFNSTAVATISTTDPTSITAGDFNGDGYPDLAVASYGGYTVAIYTGNGSGTFTLKQTITLPSSSQPLWISIGDFNNDGVLDFVTTSQTTNAAHVYLGNGDGTFTLKTTLTFSSFPTTSALGDFNGDGKLDMAIPVISSGTVAIYLGNGDGTFTLKQSPSVGTNPHGAVAADFNRDGLVDLAVANNGSASVTVLQGAGDGTFTTSATLTVPASPDLLSVGDFNGDGIPDIVVGNTTTTVLTGIAQGSFTSASLATPLGQVLTGDLNGDGLSDIVGLSGSTAVSLLAQRTWTATATATGVAVTGTGNHSINASYAGDANYAVSTSSGTDTLVAGAVTTVTTLGVLPSAPVSYGTAVTLTASVSPNSSQGHAVTGDTVTFQNGATTLCSNVAVNSSGQASCTTSALPASTTNSLTAVFAGDTNFATSTSTALPYTVNQATQAITFAPATPVTYGVSPITLTATGGGSGNAVTFSVVSGPGTISGSTLTVTGAGSIVVAANQAGNTNYTAAPQVTATIVVNQATQAITFAPSTPVTYGVSPITLTATGGASGNAVTFSVVSGPGTISGSTLTVTGAGSIVVAANQAGNTNYTAAPQVTATIVVNQATQAITFAPSSPVTYGVSPITLTATGGASGNAVTFSVVSGPGTISGSTLTVTGAGSIVVAANQAGNINYTAAPQVTATIVVNQATQAITFAPSSPVTYGVSPITLTATGGASGNAVTFSVVSGPGTISGSTLTVTGGGSIVVAANQAGNTNYTAAPQVTATIVVNQATQAITFAPSSPVTYGVSPITLTATGGASGNAVTFSVVSGPGTISGSTLTVTGAGNIQVAANQAGNANYNAAAQVTMPIVVNKATPTVTWATPAPITYGTPLSSTQLDATASVAGTNFAYSPSSGVLSAGTQTLSVTFTPADTTDYNTATATVNLTVNKATPTLSWSPLASIPYGTQLGSTQLDATVSFAGSPVNGTPVYTPGAGTVPPVGHDALSVVFTPADSNDFNTVSGSNNITVAANPSSTSLALTSGGHAASTVAAGSVVTLTATVTSSGPPVMMGTVFFCNALATFCTNNDMVGMAQLTSAGAASVSLVPAPGTYSYQAYFIGNGTATASSSSTMPLTVTAAGALYPTATSIAATGAAGSYSLTATVVGTGATTGPGTSVSFFDTTNSNFNLGTAALGTSTQGSAFTSATSVAASGATATVRGDFNNDGYMDFAMLEGNNTVVVALGSSSGSFTLSTPTSLGLTAGSLASGDFNGDGKLDLVLGTSTGNSIGVLIGHGDGTFTAAATPSYSGAIAEVAVADFNGDGNLDVVGSDSNHNRVVVFTGNGDGTFNVGSTPAVGTYPIWVAVADFNGDDIPDVVVTNYNAGTASILLGVGDGTFNAATPVNVGVQPARVAVGDFNGDGEADLVVSNYGTHTIVTYLGNGSGGFGSAHGTVTLPGNAPAIAVGDFNLDRNTDVVAAYSATNNITHVTTNALVLLQGDGNGGLTQVASQTVGTNPDAIAVGDFNGDGLPDLAVGTQNGSTNILLTQLTQTATAMLANVSPVGTGTHNVEASFPGDTHYAASVSATTGITAQPVTTTLSLSTDTSSSTYGDFVTLTATLAPYTAGGVSSDGEVVTFYNGSTSVGTGTLSSGVAILTTNALTAGTDSVRAVYAGDTNLTTSTSNTRSITVAQATPSVAWTTPAAITYGTALSATQLNATSPTPGTFVYTPVLGALLSAGSQTLSVTFTPTDTTNYSARTATVSLTVNKVTPAITWATPSGIMYGTALSATQLNATASVAGTFVYSPALGAVLGAGSQTLSVTFTPTDTSNYNPATATVSLTVTRGTTTTLLNVSSGGNTTNTVGLGAKITLTATVTSNGNAITAGTVNFCNASANYCTDQEMVGSAQLTSGGTATLSFFPGAGSHSYLAEFVGTGNAVGSNSGASSLTVTSSLATTTAITQSGSVGNYSLTATVTGTGLATAPSGTVSFLDTTSSNAQVGSATLGAGVLSASYSNAQTLSVPSGAAFAVEGDFNGDGIPDIAFSSQGASAVTIALGNGDGTFTTLTTQPTATSAYGITTGDFNGDGKLDLAVTNYANAAVTILLGNGDGTFAAGTSVAVGSYPWATAVGDFNGDGNLDLVTTNIGGNNVTILLGHGDGTFTATTVSPAVGSFPTSASVGDFNHDGKLDLAVANFHDTTVSILLGNGDGSFTAAANVNAGSEPITVVVGDLNGDGTLDLAVDNYGANNITTYLGNGDGTFGAATATLSLPGNGEGMVLADLNGDGLLDLATEYSQFNFQTFQQTFAAAIYVGDGSGGFTLASTQPTDQNPNWMLSADWNGDGSTDLAVVNGSSATILLTRIAETATATATGISPVGIGTHNIRASYPGDSHYAASVSSTVGLTAQQITTATSLAVTSAGSSVTTVAAGSPVMLTATVFNGGTPVTSGTVNFCNANAAHCTDINLLGTAQLTGAGTAALNLYPGVGSHSYRAVYAGSLTNATSASSSQALTVTGTSLGIPYATTTAISQGGSVGNYSLTATVTGTPGAFTPVTGTVSFLDTSNSNFSLGTATLGASTPSFVTTASASLLDGYGVNPNAALLGDFNHDGKLDVALDNIGDGGLTFYMGNGDGTFTSPVLIQLGGQAGQMVAGDFNHDGNPDIATGLCYGSSVSVLLGNGDGTFGSNHNFGTGFCVSVLAAGDFNGDGNLDLVAANRSQNTVTLLLGNGNGGFTAASSTVPTGNAPSGVAVGDFNRDGNLDFATANYGDNTVTVALGNGDGTFTVGTNIAVGREPQGIGVADFNEDGNLDIVVANVADGTVSVLLGDGHGGFASPATISIGSEPLSLAIGDLDGDGHADIVTSNYRDNTLSVLLGKGDGTFTSAQPISVPGSNPRDVVIGDLNGNGQPDLFLATDGANDATALLLTGKIETATATATGISPVGTGTHSVEASYPGDNHYAASVSSTLGITAQPLTTSLILIANPAGSIYGQTVTLTATLAPYASQGHSTDGELISFYIGSTLLGTANLSSGSASLQVSTLPAGSSNSLTATYAADGNFAVSTATISNYSVAPASKTINFPTLTPPVTVNDTVTLAATASNGDPVTYSITSGTAVLNGSTLTFTTAGSVTIAVNSAATANYTAAPTVTQTVTVNAAPSFVTMPTTPVGSTSMTQTITVNIGTGGTLGSIAVLTQGASGLDFRSVAGGSCAIGTVYSLGQACTVMVGFSPLHPWVRTGGVILGSQSGSSMGKTFLAGTGTGPQVVFGSATAALIQVSSGLNQPQLGVAVDGYGNLYVADVGNHRVVKIPFSAGTYGAPITLASGISPQGVAVDGVGAVYFADDTNNAIRKIPLIAGVYGSISTVASGFTPVGLALDSSDNVYYSDAGNQAIKELLRTQSSYGSPVTLAANINSTLGLAVDAVGNVYYANFSQNTINRIPYNGSSYGSPTAVVSNLSGPFSVALDGAGNLYVAEINGNSVKEVPYNGNSFGTPITLASGFQQPQGIAVDSSGSVFIEDTAGNAVRKLDLADAPALTFASTNDGSTSATQSVVVANSGNDTLATNAFTVSSSSFPTFLNGFTPAACLLSPNVAPGDSCSLNVAFAPTSPQDGVVTGTLTLTDNSLNVLGNTQTLTLSGTAVGSPSVMGLSPAFGPAAGGTQVTISGSRFTGSTGVSFGGAAATGVTVVSDSSILATSPAGTGTVDVVVTTAVGSSPTSSADHFLYQIPQTISFTPASPVTYGVAPITLTATGGASGNPVTFTRVSGPGTVTGNTLTVTGAGSIVINADQAGNGSYTAAPTVTATVVVNQATPVITWSTPASITYGTSLSATQLNATASVAGSFVYSPALGAVPAAGTDTLSVTFTPTDTANYTTATATVQLVVGKATPVITWSTPAGITYGTSLSATQLNATASVAGSFVYSPALGAVPAAGTDTLSVTFTPTDTANYTTATATVQLVVGKATPTLSWSTPASITYGTSLSATQLNATASVAGSFVYSPALGAVPAAGTDTLSVTFTPTDTANYTTATATVQLVVGKATPVITWSTPAGITYGTSLSATQLNATASVAGSFVYSPALGAVPAAGTDTLSVTFTPTDTANYTTATATVQLVVGKATPTLSWSTPAGITYGTSLSATQLNATASVAGSFVYSPALGAVPAAGTDTLSVTFTPTDTANYTTASATVQLVVGKATPTLSWSTPASITYGTSLSATQLNATASVAGSFVYSPALGAVPAAGTDTLSVTFTPTDTANYTTATATVQLVVGKATPVITWSTPAGITYGTSLSATQLNATASVAGSFVYSPALGAVPAAGTDTLSVTFTPTDTANYTTATATVQLVVGKATPTLSWSTPAGITYGTSLSATQLNATASVAGSFVYSPALGAVPAAGTDTLSVTFTPTDTANYTTASATVQLVVGKATPTLSWSTPASITYGTSLSATQLNATASVAGSFVYSPALGAVPAAGTDTLSVTFTPTDTANYTTATATVQLVVGKATPTLSWSTPAGITYGTSLSATQLNATASVAGSFVYSPALGAVPAAGTDTLSVTFTPTDTANYTTATATVQLVVGKATPVITWSTPAGITYGTSLSATQLNATASVAGSFVYSPALGAVPAAGTDTLSVTFTPTDTANYTTATTTVQLVVGKATPVITWSTPAGITYGTSLSATQLNATVSVAGSFVYSPALGAVPAAGTDTLSVTFTPTDTANYTTATATVQLVVGKATPTLSWSTPAGITYGTSLSATQLNATASVAGSFVYSPALGAVPAAGTDTLSVTFTPTDTANYTTATATVQLVVGKATPVITWSTPAGITYGTSLSATQLNATASVAGSFVYSPALGAVPAAGTDTLSVTFTPTDTANYTTATATVQLVVGKATPVITWSTPAGITYGTSLSATQLNATASVAGSFVYSPALGAVPAAGTDTLSVTFTPTDTANYTTATATVQLVVQDFAISLTSTNSATQKLEYGGSATYVFSVALSNSQTFASPVTFSATGLPPGTIATFTPATIPAGGAVNTVSMTITFPAYRAEIQKHKISSDLPLAALALLLLPIAAARSRSRKLKRMLCAIFLFGGAIASSSLISGCGSSENFTQKYLVTVTATSGTLTHSTQVTLMLE